VHYIGNYEYINIWGRKWVTLIRLSIHVDQQRLAIFVNCYKASGYYSKANGFEQVTQKLKNK